MKKFFLIYGVAVFSLMSTLVLFFLVPRISQAADQVATTGRRPIDATLLIYHRVGEEQYPTTNVSVERFQEQLSYLKENRFKVIPLRELVTALKSGESLPPKSVVITIDDGYKSTYTEAWPLLKSYGFPFTVFLYVKAVEGRYRNFLNWDDVREMAAAGVDFQDHSFSHHRLADWPHDMDEQAYRAWISKDLSEGFRLLTARLGKQPRFFAVPYGEYNSIVLEEAKKVGYDAIFSQDPGSVSKETDPFLIPREPILGDEWASMAHFEKVLNRVDLPFVKMEPGIDPLSNNTPPRFGARLLHPERYRPDSFGIYVSELGWRKALIDGDFVYVENETSLTRRLNRVMISAKEKEGGRTALRFWLLMKR